MSVDPCSSPPRAERIRATPLQLLVAFPCVPVARRELFARILQRTSDIPEGSASHVTHGCLSDLGGPTCRKVPKFHFHNYGFSARGELKLTFRVAVLDRGWGQKWLVRKSTGGMQPSAFA